MLRHVICQLRLLLLALTVLPMQVWQVSNMLGEDQGNSLPDPLTIAAAKHHRGNAQSVAISPDGTLVAAAFGGASTGRFPLKPTDGGIAVWKTDTGERIQFIGEYGDIVSLIGAGGVMLLDIESGKTLRQFDIE